MFRFICIVIFLIVYLILSIPVFLVEWVVGKFNPYARDISSLRIVQWGFKVILKIAGVRATVIGEENVPDEAVLFVGNHRSYFDIPLVLVSFDRPHGILAKEELARIPLLSRWMHLLGCVYVQRDDVRGSVQALKDAAAVVRGGDSFTIFPEGTRYKGEEGGVGEFKAGAFRIAIKTGVPVVPVAISGARGLYESHNYIVHPGTVRVSILPAIHTAGMSKDEQRQLPEAVRQNILAALSRLDHTVI